MSSLGTCFQEIPRTCVLVQRKAEGAAFMSSSHHQSVNFGEVIFMPICPAGWFVLSHEYSISGTLWNQREEPGLGVYL